MPPRGRDRASSYPAGRPRAVIAAGKRKRRASASAFAAQRAEERAAVLDRFDVSRETAARLDTYVALLDAWQAHINLVAPSTLAGVWQRHIADSLALTDLLPPFRTAVDLGSGAGLPGMIVAAARNDAEDAASADGFRLDWVESNGKKAAFLRRARGDLGLPGTVHAARIEDRGAVLAEADVVLARALAPLDRLCALVRPHLRPETRCFFQKGRDHAAEIETASANWQFTMIKHESDLDDGSVVLEIAGIEPR